MEDVCFVWVYSLSSLRDLLGAWIFGIQAIHRGSHGNVLMPTGHNCWPCDKCTNDTTIHFSVSPPLACRNLWSLSPASFEQQVWCHRESGACPGLQNSHYLSSSLCITWYIHHAGCTRRWDMRICSTIHKKTERKNLTTGSSTPCIQKCPTSQIH
jgi:hypothetical protein